MPGFVTRRAFLATTAIAVAAGGTSSTAPLAAAEEARTSLDPRLFGLNIPAGPLRYDEQRWLTSDTSGQQTVARSHVGVGQHEVVILPEGQIAVRAVAECTATEKPFSSADREKLAARLVANGPLQGFQTKLSRRYLFLYNCSEPFQQVTQRILETMMLGVIEFARSMRIDVSEPDLPLIVILFRDVAEYQRYRRMPEGVLAYYDLLDNRVSIYEQSPATQVMPQIALEQALSTIAHEGAHQILHNIGVQQRLSLWPMWVTEGVAEYLAPTTTGKNLRWKGAGQVNDWRMFELEQYIKGGAGEMADGAMIEEVVGASQLSSTGYAAAWALVHFLIINERLKFTRYFRELSQMRPLEGERTLPPAARGAINRQEFEKHFGADYAQLEKRLILHLKKQSYDAPFAGFPHIVACVVSNPQRRPRREANIFLTPADALRWQRETIEKLPEALRPGAISEMHRFPNRLTAETFANQWLRAR